ncbi:mitochondrial 50S ribosomal protein L3 [Auriculariales sp. MPI-PUGE-AT-0066]|nr:mitochondrial 50S ribosomal protein L3 [Auriculariales sp. MPI-PUGE-AT-0066]
MSLVARVAMRPSRTAVGTARLMHASTSALATPTKMPKAAEKSEIAENPGPSSTDTTAKSASGTSRARILSLDGQTLPLPAGRWRPESLRTGVIAFKRGMTSMFDDHGTLFPVTVLQLEECQVTGNIKHVRPDGTEYHAVQVGAGIRKPKNVSHAMRGHFRKAAVQTKHFVKEFPVSPEAHLAVGTTLNAVHFVPGQFVDVQARSNGKGWAGGMKRWGFSGLSASHGVSVSHRSSGSTGQHQDPGRVWPGKKMAGRMGGEYATQQNLYVAGVDSQLNLIYIRGCLPGVDDATVFVVDAKKKVVSNARTEKNRGRQLKILPRGVNDLPFPAGTEKLASNLPPIVMASSNRSNPWVAR